MAQPNNNEILFLNYEKIKISSDMNQYGPTSAYTL